jgi:glycosyltransferase involved in cell wall biosynthesis
VNNKICLDKNYSTTRSLTKEKLEVARNTEEKFESILFLPEDNGRKGGGGLRVQGYFKESYDNRPLISIITVVYNGEGFLEETIQSVISQTYDNVEYILIDGGSTDETVNIIKKYENRIDYWISEKDDGIYDAMNKGLVLAKGRYVYFMGSDDRLIKNSLTKIFNGILIKTDKLIALPVAINNVTNLAYPAIEFPVSIVHHQGAIFNLLNLKQIGLYSNKYKFHSDFDLMCKYVSKYGVQYLDNPICIFRKGGASTSGANAIQSMKELLHIYFTNSGKILSTKWIMFIVRPIYYFACGIIRK